MLRIVLLWALLTGLPAAPARAMDATTARAWQTGLIAPDKLAHLSLSFTGGLAIGVLSRQPGLGVGSALALGLAKELRDRHPSGFDPADLAADAAGALLAGLATRSLTR
jgi:hypothetical protein